MGVMVGLFTWWHCIGQVKRNRDGVFDGLLQLLGQRQMHPQRRQEIAGEEHGLDRMPIEGLKMWPTSKRKRPPAGG